MTEDSQLFTRGEGVLEGFYVGSTTPTVDVFLIMISVGASVFSTDTVNGHFVR